jgi:hypothetical protein
MSAERPHLQGSEERKIGLIRNPVVSFRQACVTAAARPVMFGEPRRIARRPAIAGLVLSFFHRFCSAPLGHWTHGADRATVPLRSIRAAH